MAEGKPEQAAPQQPKQQAGMLKKILVIGVPAFLIQLVLVYILTAKFLIPVSLQNSANMLANGGSAHAAQNGDGSGKDTNSQEEFLFVVKDLIINPAGTNGQRYLLTTIGFNVSTEEARKEMEKKEMLLRDALNSVLTSKGMDDLIDVSKREVLRHEIYLRCKELVKAGKLQSVYFSKFIIQ